MARDRPEGRSRLFAYPDKLLAALESDPPDVLMLSNDMWNDCLSFHFAAMAKRTHPDTLVVMGGPRHLLGCGTPRASIRWRDGPERAKGPDDLGGPIRRGTDRCRARERGADAAPGEPGLSITVARVAANSWLTLSGVRG